MPYLIRNLLFRFCILLVIAQTGGCGGGGGGASVPSPPPPPSGLSYPSPQSVRLNSPIGTLTPTVSGAVSSFSVSPTLPAGLTLNSTSGVISGTPTQTAPTTTYTITASNSSGSTSFGLSLTVFTVTVQSSGISRLSAAGTSIYPAIKILPVNLQVSQLYANAVDASGLFLPAVTTVANSDGTFTLQLTTNPSVSADVFSGNVTLNLCRDAPCGTALEVPSVAVPFTVTVLSNTSTWPGDHLTDLPSSTTLPDWAMFQGNASHTGFVPTTVDPDKETTRWRIPGISNYDTWIPLKQNVVTSNGLLFVVASDYLTGGEAFSKRESDGSDVWNFSVATLMYPSASPAAVSGGVVYFPAGHQGSTYLYALNAANGTQVYQAQMSSQWEDYLAPTVGPNGMVYAEAGSYGGIYAFNPSGQQLFFSYAEQTSDWTPAVDSNAVYSYVGSRLQVNDPLTGAVLQSITDPTFQNFVYEIGGAPVLGAPGSVFAANYANAIFNGVTTPNTLSNFRTDTGTIGWQVAGKYPTTPAYNAGVVYAVNNIPFRLEARAESDGSLLWSWTPATGTDTEFVSEVLLTKNLVFVSTDQATYAIDLTSHVPAFSYPASGKLELSANSILYIQNGAKLVAINLQ